MTVLGMPGSSMVGRPCASSPRPRPPPPPAPTPSWGLLEDRGAIPHDTADGALRALVDAGEARAAPRHLGVTRAGGSGGSWPGSASTSTVSAPAHRRLRPRPGPGPRRPDPGLGGPAPRGRRRRDRAGGGHAAGRVSLHALPLRARRGAGPGRISCFGGSATTARPPSLALVAGAVDRARDLQNTPPNDLPPAALGERARAIAAEAPALSAPEVGGAEALRHRTGAFLAVAQGSAAEPGLGVPALRAPRGGAGRPPARARGQGRFDSGGLSIKPAGSMAGMKFDMSGGAAVLEGAGGRRTPGAAAARRHRPSGRDREHAVGPGGAGHRARRRRHDDRGQQHGRRGPAGPGRLPAARPPPSAPRAWSTSRDPDRRDHERAGSTYAGLQHRRRARRRALVEEAGLATGDLVWRLPLHPDRTPMVKGRYADLVNGAEGAQGGAVRGRAVIRPFAGDVPWAHLDIAGVADDAGRPWARAGASACWSGLTRRWRRGAALRRVDPGPGRAQSSRRRRGPPEPPKTRFQYSERCMP